MYTPGKSSCLDPVLVAHTRRKSSIDSALRGRKHLQTAFGPPAVAIGLPPRQPRPKRPGRSRQPAVRAGRPGLSQHRRRRRQEALALTTTERVGRVTPCAPCRGGMLRRRARGVARPTPWQHATRAARRSGPADARRHATLAPMGVATHLSSAAIHLFSPSSGWITASLCFLRATLAVMGAPPGRSELHRSPCGRASGEWNGITGGSAVGAASL